MTTEETIKKWIKSKGKATGMDPRTYALTVIIKQNKQQTRLLEKITLLLQKGETAVEPAPIPQEILAKTLTHNSTEPTAAPKPTREEEKMGKQSTIREIETGKKELTPEQTMALWKFGNKMKEVTNKLAEQVTELEESRKEDQEKSKKKLEKIRKKLIKQLLKLTTQKGGFEIFKEDTEELIDKKYLETRSTKEMIETLENIATEISKLGVKTDEKK